MLLCVCVCSPQESEEYGTAAAMLVSSIPGAEVVQVKRVECPEMFKGYSDLAHALLQRLTAVLNLPPGHRRARGHTQPS